MSTKGKKGKKSTTVTKRGSGEFPVDRLEPRVARGNQVQYLGDIEAYSGQKGEVTDVMSSKKAAVLFKGATNPISLIIEDLMVIAPEDIAEQSVLATSDRPRYRFIANTSGGLHFIPDLQNATMREGIGFAACEVIDLLSIFTPQEINRSRGLINSVEKISAQTGLPYITVLESLDDLLPEGADLKSLVDRVKPGTVLEAEESEYDDKLYDVYEREEKQAERMSATSTKFKNRKTKQHGRASSGLGR